MRQWWPLAVIAAVFVALCCAYNSATPYRKAGVLLHQLNPDRTPMKVPDVGAPDERQHANYVRWLMDGKGFPVLVPGSPDLYETYQAHQPPLYYLLAAGWCRLTGTDPSSANGFNLRFLNTLIGLATMTAIAASAWWAFESRALAFGASAFLLMPMFVALHSAASNDPLLFCLCSWALALLALAARNGWDRNSCLLLGLACGLAFLTKTTAVALVPAVGLGLFVSGRPAERKTFSLNLSLGALLALVLGGLWWARNMSLYGDPFAMSAFKASFVGSPQASLFLDVFGLQGYWLNMVLWWTARSFVGVFGYMDVFLNDAQGMAVSDLAYLRVLGALTVFGLAGLLKIKDVKPGPGKTLVFSAAGFLVVVTVLFVGFNNQYFQGQARYLYPAVSPIAMLVGAGACKLCQLLRLSTGWGAVVLGVGLALLNLLVLSQLQAAFAARLVN